MKSFFGAFFGSIVAMVAVVGLMHCCPVANTCNCNDCTCKACCKDGNCKCVSCKCCDNCVGHKNCCDGGKCTQEKK